MNGQFNNRRVVLLEYVSCVLFMCNVGLVLFYRFRCICMVFVFAAGAIIWQNHQFLSTYTSSVLPLRETGT